MGAHVAAGGRGVVEDQVVGAEVGPLERVEVDDPHHDERGDGERRRREHGAHDALGRPRPRAPAVGPPDDAHPDAHRQRSATGPLEGEGRCVVRIVGPRRGRPGPAGMLDRAGALDRPIPVTASTVSSSPDSSTRRPSRRHRRGPSSSRPSSARSSSSRPSPSRSATAGSSSSTSSAGPSPSGRSPSGPSGPGAAVIAGGTPNRGVEPLRPVRAAGLGRVGRSISHGQRGASSQLGSVSGGQSKARIRPVDVEPDVGGERRAEAAGRAGRRHRTRARPRTARGTRRGGSG